VEHVRPRALAGAAGYAPAMLVRGWSVAFVGLLTLVLLVPAACSGGDESTPGGADSMTPGGAGAHVGGDAAGAGAGRDAVSNAGGAADGGALGGAGAPLGGMAGAASDGGAGAPMLGGAPTLGGSGAGGAGVCGAMVAEQPLASGVHVTACSDIVYATNPPSSGEHYGSWADFGVYDFALPRGYWMHNLEHGAVVVTYHCDDACDDELVAAKAWLAGLQPDAACPSGPPRVILVPDPRLDVRWAASSWGFTLRADCFDAGVFSDFYAGHVGRLPAPEWAICQSGQDFRASGACGVK